MTTHFRASHEADNVTGPYSVEQIMYLMKFKICVSPSNWSYTAMEFFKISMEGLSSVWCFLANKSPEVVLQSHLSTSLILNHKEWWRWGGCLGPVDTNVRWVFFLSPVVNST